jgi:cytochrome P450
MTFLSQFDALASLGADPAAVARARAGLLSEWVENRSLELFAELRANRPTLVTPGLCVVTRAPDVREVLANDRVFTVRPYTARMERTTGAFILGMSRDGQYDRELAALHLASDRADVANVAAIAQKSAERIVKDAEPAGRLNLAEGYARRVAYRVIADYYGVPGPDEPTMCSWIRILFRDIFLNLGNDPAIIAAAKTAADGLKAYLVPLIAALRGKPATAKAGDDVLSRLADLRIGNQPALDEDGVLRNIGGTIVGALETVNKAFVQAFDQLLERPDALQAARVAATAGDEANVLGALMEAMRFRPQNPFLYRLCEEPYTLARGTNREAEVPVGTLVFAATASAMVDAASVPAPDEFRLGRPPETYLFFGHSSHVCLGLFVAPVEFRELMKPLLRLKGLRRAAGDDGQLRFDGPYPTSLWVEWDK